MTARLDNLTKVGGNSFEDVTKRLDVQGVKYVVIQEPATREQYFRDSMIGVPEGDLSTVRASLGCDALGNTTAFYRRESGYVGDQNRLIMKDGLLVERVVVCRQGSPCDPNDPANTWDRGDKDLEMYQRLGPTT